MTDDHNQNFDTSNVCEGSEEGLVDDGDTLDEIAEESDVGLDDGSESERILDFSGASVSSQLKELLKILQANGKKNLIPPPNMERAPDKIRMQSFAVLCVLFAFLSFAIFGMYSLYLGKLEIGLPSLIAMASTGLILARILGS